MSPVFVLLWRRWWCCLWLGFAVSGTGSLRAQEEEALPLPRLTDQDMQALQNGGVLPGFGVLFNPPEDDQMLASRSLADSPDDRQPKSDLSKFLPPSLMAPSRPASRPPADESPFSLIRIFSDVGRDYLDQARLASNEMLLIDPNGELHESAHEEFQHFLEFHARDCKLTLHVLLMGKDEQLPPNVLPVGNTLEQGRACVAVVPMGDVKRTRLFMSRDIVEAAKASNLASILDDVVKHAQSSPETEEQLHRLLVRLSIRLFKLEHVVVPTTALEETVLPAVVVGPAPAPLLEVGKPPARNPGWPWWLGIGVVLAGAGWLVWWRWRTHTHRTHEWHLPERPLLTPRLGGAHCGGAAGVAWR